MKSKKSFLIHPQYRALRPEHFWKRLNTDLGRTFLQKMMEPSERLRLDFDTTKHHWLTELKSVEIEFPSKLHHSQGHKAVFFFQCTDLRNPLESLMLTLEKLTEEAGLWKDYQRFFRMLEQDLKNNMKSGSQLWQPIYCTYYPFSLG